MRLLPFIALFLLNSLFASAQQIIVTDSLTHEPLPSVLVYQASSQQSALTDEKGRFVLDDFHENEPLIFQLLGYKTKQIPFSTVKRSPSISLTEAVISLQEVVTSASRWKQEKKHIPQKILKITPREIAIENPQTSADLLASTGQVFVQKSQQGGGSPMIRGFSANSVLIVMDGIRMNNAIFRSGNLQNVILIDPLSLESAEVVFGPGSVMFGSDALGGVMNFTTHDPEFSSNEKWNVFGDALVRYASANHERTTHIDANFGHHKWAFYHSFTYSDFDDLRTGSFRESEFPEFGTRPEFIIRQNGEDVIVPNDEPNVQKFTGYWQFNQMHKVRYQLSDSSHVQYAFHHTTSSVIPRYDRLTRYRNGQLRHAQWHYGPQRWQVHQLRWEHDQSVGFADGFKLNFSFQTIDESRHSRDFQSTKLENQLEKVDVWAFNADFEKSLSDQLNLTYGAEINYNEVTSEGFAQNIDTGEITPIESRYPNEGSEVLSSALYGNLLWKPSPKISLTTGLRFNLYRLHAESSPRLGQQDFTEAEINTSSVNGSLGITWRPNNQWQLNAHAGSGFRAPNVDDIGKVFELDGDQLVIPNPGLSPENVYSIEAGIERAFGEKVKISFTAYRSWLRDRMVRNDFALNGSETLEINGNTLQIQAVQNTGQAYVYGMHTQLIVQLTPNWRWASSYNLNKGKDRDNDDPLRHVPPGFGESVLEWKDRKWKARLQFRFSEGFSLDELNSGEQRKVGTHYRADGSPAWSVWDLQLQYQVNRNLHVQGGIENLADVHYRTYSSGISAPGRNFQLAIRGKF